MVAENSFHHFSKVVRILLLRYKEGSAQSVQIIVIYGGAERAIYQKATTEKSFLVAISHITLWTFNENCIALAE